MNSRNLGLIVEGHGDVKAMPILVRRLVEELYPGLRVDIPEPYRLKRGLMSKEPELHRAVELVSKKVGPGSPVLIVLDADDDSGCHIAPAIQDMALQARSDRRIGVVAAVREFEAWLIAGIAPLAGRFGLEASLPDVNNAEFLPNPKAWLKRYMDAYSETVDQAKLTAAIDLSLARRIYSFDKLERELVRLLGLPSAPPR